MQIDNYIIRDIDFVFNMKEGVQITFLKSKYTFEQCLAELGNPVLPDYRYLRQVQYEEQGLTFEAYNSAKIQFELDNDATLLDAYIQKRDAIKAMYAKH